MTKSNTIDLRMAEVIGSGNGLVDLGCGGGRILDAMAGCFQIRIGIDAYETRKDMRNVDPIGWELLHPDLNPRFPLADNYADAVIANRVIEHILDPGHFVAEIHRVLRRGGRCVITTPNIRYLKHLAHLLVSGYGPRTAGGNVLDGEWDDGHLHYFMHRDLRELFAQIGFRQIESRALIDLQDAGLLRHRMDHYAAARPIREFLSGCILFWAEK